MAKLILAIIIAGLFAWAYAAHQESEKEEIRANDVEVRFHQKIEIFDGKNSVTSQSTEVVEKIQPQLNAQKSNNIKEIEISYIEKKWMIEKEIFRQGFKMKVIATAYYKPLKKQKSYMRGSYKKDIKLNGRGITYLGDKAKVGHIAVDPTVIPFNAELHVPGYGKGKARDIGSAIKGNRIDVFMGTGEKALQRALEWGVKEIEITVKSG